MKPETFKNMGLKNTLSCGFSYLGAMFKKLPEDNNESGNLLGLEKENLKLQRELRDTKDELEIVKKVICIMGH